MRSTTLHILLVALAVVACDPEEVDTSSVIDEYLNLPDPPYKYYKMTASDQQIQLGRVLFYDPTLSKNGTVSCASCHKQEYAFGDNVAFSKGFEGGLTLRNTLPLVDARQVATAKVEPNSISPMGGLFWDGRTLMMQDAVMEPIFNHIEMGMDGRTLRHNLHDRPYYPPLFKEAYGDDEITYDGVKQALAAFVSVLQSNSSRFERLSGGQANLSAIENKGLGLFNDKYRCIACHQGHMGVNAGPAYHSTAEFANIGLEAQYADNGLSLVTKSARDEGRFRIPNLSNVALTAPYMHDGSIATLEEVVEHYFGGMQSHANLDPRLKGPDNLPLRFTLIESEKEALVAFLKTFTDDDVATNPRLSNPFREKEN